MAQLGKVFSRKLHAAVGGGVDDLASLKKLGYHLRSVEVVVHRLIALGQEIGHFHRRFLCRQEPLETAIAISDFL